MKYKLIILAIHFLFVGYLVNGQHTTTDGIFVIDKDHALRGGHYLGEIELDNDNSFVFNGELPSKVSGRVLKAGGNTLRIRTDYILKNNKAIFRTVGEIYDADRNNVQVIPVKEHIDSLHATLGFDTAKEALIVLFSSPKNKFKDGQALFHTFRGVEGCSMRAYAVCSYIMPGGGVYATDMGGFKSTEVKIETGRVYFLEIFLKGTDMTTSRLVSLDYGYRICKAYQDNRDKK